MYIIVKWCPLPRCCEEWKESYSEITATLTEHSQLAQLPDGAGIFTQIDAFMQRCRDLQDIADCQAQFARWLDGEKAPVPNIGQSGKDTRGVKSEVGGGSFRKPLLF